MTFKKVLIILSIIALCFLSALSLGEFYFSTQSGQSEYYLFIISILCFCIGSALFWLLLKQAK